MFISFGNWLSSGFLWIGSWIDDEISPSSSYSYEEYDY